MADILWTKDKVEWLRIALATPDNRTGKVPGDSKLANMASEHFGESITRHQIRHATIKYLKSPEEPLDVSSDISPDVALLLSRLSALEKQLQVERDRSVIIRDAIRQTVLAIPPLKPFPTVPTPDGDSHVAMLDISDVHIGEKVDPVLTGGLSQYSFDLFKSRGERLRRGFSRIVGLHRRMYPVDTIYINFIGDIVTGESIYSGQAFQIDMPLLMQVFEGGYWFAGLLRELAASFKEVHVRCIAGNHGRGGKKGENHPRTNWDTAIYLLLKTMLSAHENIDFEISETSFLVYRIPGHDNFNHALIHGDQAMSSVGMPWYGFERTGSRMSSMLGMPIDFLHAGHHHNEAEWMSNQVEFLINGSWVGGSDLSVNRLMRTSRPTQNLFFCHPKRGVVAPYRIQLAEWSEMTPDKRGVYSPVSGNEKARS